MTKSKNIKIGVIGFGNMARAIFRQALTKKIIHPQNILSLAHHPAHDQKLKSKLGITICPDMSNLARQSQIILLAVKPGQMQAVLKDLKPHYHKQLVLTVAAGIPVKIYQKILGRTSPVMRLMPNMPTTLGLGVTTFYCSPPVSPAQKKAALHLLRETGLVFELKQEKLLEPAMTVAGSGPAFVYRYALAVAEAGHKLGLSKKTSLELTLRTMLGSIHMLEETNLDPEKLIAQVTSKGGTTLAGLSVLDKMNFNGMMLECLKAARQRSSEIGHEITKEMS